jgi:hypothetical protein
MQHMKRPASAGRFFWREKHSGDATSKAGTFFIRAGLSSSIAQGSLT